MGPEGPSCQILLCGYSFVFTVIADDYVLLGTTAQPRQWSYLPCPNTNRIYKDL